MRAIRLIVVHHTAGNAGLAEIERWHKRRGFSSIGYHYVIDRAGRVHETRDIARIGAHARGFNRHSIGVALIGNFEKELPSAVQLNALAGLLKRLKEAFPNAEIVPHCALRPTKCPGRHLKSWLTGYNAAR